MGRTVDLESIIISLIRNDINLKLLACPSSHDMCKYSVASLWAPWQRWRLTVAIIIGCGLALALRLTRASPGEMIDTTSRDAARIPVDRGYNRLVIERAQPRSRLRQQPDPLPVNVDRDRDATMVSTLYSNSTPRSALAALAGRGHMHRDLAANITTSSSSPQPVQIGFLSTVPTRMAAENIHIQMSTAMAPIVKPEVQRLAFRVSYSNGVLCFDDLSTLRGCL